MEIFLCKNMKGFLVTMNIGKAFCFFDHAFIINVLKKIRFRETFIAWIRLLLNNLTHVLSIVETLCNIFV